MKRGIIIDIDNILCDIFKFTQKGDSKELSILLDLLSDRHDEILEDGKELSCFKVLDTFPEQILDNKKLEQVESIFDKQTEIDILNETEKYKTYKKMERKFIQFFKILWVCSKEVFTFFYINKGKLENLDPSVWKVLGESLEQINFFTKDGENLLLLDNFILFESLIKASVADKIFITIIVPNRKLLFLSNGENYGVYFLEDMDWVEKVAMTEGLFIRS